MSLVVGSSVVKFRLLTLGVAWPWSAGKVKKCVSAAALIGLFHLSTSIRKEWVLIVLHSAFPIKAIRNPCNFESEAD